MRYLPHLLLAYLAIGLQIGLGALLSVGAAMVSLPWVATAYIAATVPPAIAPMASVGVGLVVDLVWTAPLGTHAFAYGLGGLLVAKMRTNRVEGWIAAAAGGAFVVTILTWLLGLFQDGGRGLLASLGSALFTSLLILLLAWPMWKARRRFLIDDRRL